MEPLSTSSVPWAAATKSSSKARIGRRRIPLRCTLAITFALAAHGCSEQEPPGAAGQGATPVVVEADRSGAADAEAPAPSSPRIEPGSRDDSLPFEPTGQKLASIAWRTWIYTDVGPRRTRFGYLRAGAVVDRRGPEIKNEGCRDGWWRVNPRGFVCIGRGATLDLGHPVVVASRRRPVRGKALPYVYAMARERAPHLYFRMPTPREMNTVEGEDTLGRGIGWKVRALESGLLETLGEPGAPPDHVRAARELPKPYGVDRRLHYSVHAGQASSDSGFAIGEIYDWHGRLFGLTTELDLIAMDRTKVVVPSAFHGVELGPEDDLPVAFIEQPWVLRYERDEDGQMIAKGSFRRRDVLNLTGKTERYQHVKFWETSEGAYLPTSSALILDKRTSFPSVATGTRKWIDISIRHQTLVAFQGTKAVYATLVSTGRGGMGDPEKVPATVRGTFMIHSKHVTSTMDGEEDVSDSFNLRDVPFVQYFHKGFALHGTYWHDDFGKIRSHGCVNLSPIDAAWLFEWTDPQVPDDWHGAINKERGTVVVIHP